MNDKASASASPRPIKVAFDHTVFADQHRGGITRYLAGLLQHLDEFGVEGRALAPLYVSDSLRTLPRGRVWGRPIPNKRVAKLVAKSVGIALDRPLATLFGADIVHESFYSRHRTAPAGKPVVVTMLDMIHEHWPHLFSGGDTTLARKPASIARADHIICISESTRRDLIGLYPEAEAKASVVLLGFDPQFAAGADRTARLHERPYVLFVGMRRDYKNFSGLVEAFGRSRLAGEDIDLVCLGDGPLRDHEQALIAKAGLEGRVFQRDADDQALRSWYRHALLFAYPSLYEGFGIPPLEAMAADCPVVCMRRSSLPEVCGEAAEYAEPDDPDSLVAALEAVALSPARADALREAGHEQTRKFSWRKCAEETSAVYRSLL